LANQLSRRGLGAGAKCTAAELSLPAESSIEHDLTRVELGADATDRWNRAEQMPHLVSLGGGVDEMYERVELTGV
jgi:hypothetical protein